MAGLAVMAALGARHMDEPVPQRLARFSRIGTIDLRVDYLRPGISEHFELRAEVTRIGSRVASTRMEFLGADGTLLATGTAAYIVSSSKVRNGDSTTSGRRTRIKSGNIMPKRYRTGADRTRRGAFRVERSRSIGAEAQLNYHALPNGRHRCSQTHE